MLLFSRKTFRSYFVVSSLILSVFGGSATFAAESDVQTSTLKVDSDGFNKKFQETRTLTDSKLRADDGSMSQYSMKFNLSYFGPTLNDFSAKDQPNPDGSVGVYATALGGSISARYRMSSTQTLSLSSGVKAIYPLHGVERFDINNPSLYYDVSSRVGALQMRNSAGISVITIPVFRNIGEYAGLKLDNSMVYDFGGTRLAVGFDTGISYYLFDRDYQPKDGRVSRYEISFSPTLKYRFSDKLNAQTSLSTRLWNPRRLSNEVALHNKTITQSLGLGYALTKEIYLSPYLYFFPDRLSVDGTTINMSAIFSIL